MDVLNDFNVLGFILVVSNELDDDGNVRSGEKFRFGFEMMTFK